MNAPPLRPQGVRIIHPDGSKVPVELSYSGLDNDGIHVWEAITCLHHGDRVQIAMLPGNTAISFPDGDAS